MLTVEFSDVAEKFARRLPPKQKSQVGRRINALSVDPFAFDTRELHGLKPFRRADVGEYRIIYRVSEAVLYVALVGKRNDDEVYRKLRRMVR